MKPLYVVPSVGLTGPYWHVMDAESARTCVSKGLDVYKVDKLRKVDSVEYFVMLSDESVDPESVDLLSSLGEN